ncbi:MAG: FliO/MopB family protein [Clostridia bacterium]|nr:FliO/MopB family protein [Clostridia bacterium]
MYNLTYALTSYNRADDLWFTIRYIIVATLFICILWIFSKAITKKNYISLKDRRIKVVERTLLSNDKSLLLVELENIFYVLSMDKNGIQLIDKREDLTHEQFVKDEVQGLSFMNQLKASIIKRDKDKESRDE